MSNDPILHLLGLAKKAGKLEIGEEPVGAVCRSRHARLLLLAKDAAPNTCRRAAHFGEAGNVLWLQLPHDKAELGFLLGRKSCAMVAVTDFGIAGAIGEKLAALDERYAPAAAQLKEKADRALQRQKEKRQHEKNVRQGKKKPWAVPAPKQEEQAKLTEYKKAAHKQVKVQKGEGFEKKPYEKKPFDKKFTGKKSFEKKPYDKGGKKSFDKKPFQKGGEQAAGRPANRKPSLGGRKLTAKRPSKP